MKRQTEILLKSWKRIYSTALENGVDSKEMQSAISAHRDAFSCEKAEAERRALYIVTSCQQHEMKKRLDRLCANNDYAMEKSQ